MESSQKEKQEILKKYFELESQLKSANNEILELKKLILKLELKLEGKEENMQTLVSHINMM